MYSTCLFCRSKLGSNETIEHFPVGRRLAFDSKNGRLWVVCRSCEKWNLSPIEERWEAIEECERAFEGTRLRVSTDEIGLARPREGLELVRIGKPKRPELAAWRYGDQFGRRRKKRIVLAGVAAASAGAIIVGQFAFGAFASTAAAIQIANGVRGMILRRSRGVVLNAKGERLALSSKQVEECSIVWSRSKSDWSLVIPWTDWWKFGSGKGFDVLSAEAKEYLRNSGTTSGIIEVEGVEAKHALSKLLASVNLAGGTAKTVQSAVSAIEDVGDADNFLRRSGQMFAANRRLLGMTMVGSGLLAIPNETRLAMEIATNEQTEREALLGELGLLEQAWREAEEVASISDKLLVSRKIQEALQDIKNRNSKG